MTRKKAIFLASVALVVGLAIGGLAVFVWYSSIASVLGDSAIDNLAGQLQSEAYARYRLSDYPACRPALLEHAEFSAALASRAEGIRRHVQSRASALSYARAAVAAERAGATADGAQLLRLALEQYARINEHPNPDQLRSLVLSLDQDWNQDSGRQKE